MIDACQAAGTTLAVGFVRRFDPNWGMMRQMVRDGKADAFISAGMPPMCTGMIAAVRSVIAASAAFRSSAYFAFSSSQFANALLPPYAPQS